MIKYYTRACNFKYGSIARQLIKNNKALPLCGNKNIAFDESGNIVKEIFICKGNKTTNWKNCTGVLFANEIGQENCNFNIYMNSKIYMGIKHNDVGFYAYPPCEMFVGYWKNGKQFGVGKYMYWAKKDDGYREIKYFSGTLSEIIEKFNKEFR